MNNNAAILFLPLDIADTIQFLSTSIQATLQATANESVHRGCCKLPSSTSGATKYIVKNDKYKQKTNNTIYKIPKKNKYKTSIKALTKYFNCTQLIKLRLLTPGVIVLPGGPTHGSIQNPKFR
jgi:hypothetical protein